MRGLPLPQHVPVSRPRCRAELLAHAVAHPDAHPVGLVDQDANAVSLAERDAIELGDTDEDLLERLVAEQNDDEDGHAYAVTQQDAHFADDVAHPDDIEDPFFVEDTVAHTLWRRVSFRHTCLSAVAVVVALSVADAFDNADTDEVHLGGARRADPHGHAITLDLTVGQQDAESFTVSLQDCDDVEVAVLAEHALVHTLWRVVSFPDGHGFAVSVAVTVADGFANKDTDARRNDPDADIVADADADGDVRARLPCDCTEHHAVPHPCRNHVPPREWTRRGDKHVRTV